MRTYSVAFLGFGNVAKALVRLLETRRMELAIRYATAWRPTGVATRSLRGSVVVIGLPPLRGRVGW